MTDLARKIILKKLGKLTALESKTVTGGRTIEQRSVCALLDDPLITSSIPRIQARDSEVCEYQAHALGKTRE